MPHALSWCDINVSSWRWKDSDESFSIYLGRLIPQSSSVQRHCLRGQRTAKDLTIMVLGDSRGEREGIRVHDISVSALCVTYCEWSDIHRCMVCFNVSVRRAKCGEWAVNAVVLECSHLKNYKKAVEFIIIAVQCSKSSRLRKSLDYRTALIFASVRDKTMLLTHRPFRFPPPQWTARGRSARVGCTRTSSDTTSKS